MTEPTRVKMAEYSIGQAPEVLITIGLGSCVGVALYDTYSRIGGMVHIMLPENRKGMKPSKFADTGIPFLVDKMVKAGASRNSIIAKIAGGAHMFNNGSDINIQIGKRNIKAVCQVLNDLNIRIAAKDVGG